MKSLQIVVIFLLMISILLFLYGVSKFNSDGAECLKNPLSYGAKDLSTRNNADFSCTCILDKPNSPIIYFDSDNFTVRFPENEYISPIDDYSIDWSEIIVED